MGGFLNALSILAPVAPAMSDAKDLRTQREQEQQQFAQDQALRQAQITAQQFVAQDEQQRIRAGNQVIPQGDPYWQGTKMVQRVLDPNKGFTLRDAPEAESPQQKLKNIADEWQQVHGKPMPDDLWRQAAASIYGVSLPKSEFKQYSGDAGKPWKDPSTGHTYVSGTDENGNPARQDMGIVPVMPSANLSADEAAQLNRLYKANPKAPYFTEGMSRADANMMRSSIQQSNSANRQADALADRGSWTVVEGDNGSTKLLNSKTGEMRDAPPGLHKSGFFAKQIAPLDAASLNIKSYMDNGVFDGPGDLSLQHEFFTATQPATGFRMTKVQQDTLQNSRSWLGSLQAKALHAATGKWYTDTQRQQIAAAAQEAIAAKKQIMGAAPAAAPASTKGAPKTAADYWSQQ